MRSIRDLRAGTHIKIFAGESPAAELLVDGLLREAPEDSKLGVSYRFIEQSRVWVVDYPHAVELEGSVYLVDLRACLLVND